MSEATALQTLTMEQRSDILARHVSQQVRQGWRVISQTQTQVQLVKGKPTNHILHLILSILTIGIWLIVWIAMVIFGGEDQKFISVTETGQIL